MNKTTPQVDAYLAQLAPERRAALSALRSLLFRVMPDAVETMKYRMPTYVHEDRVLAAFASQKRYMSLYLDPQIVEKHRDELKGLNVGKSRIHFRKLEQLPLDSVRRMLEEVLESKSQ